MSKVDLPRGIPPPPAKPEPSSDERENVVARPVEPPRREDLFHLPSPGSLLHGVESAARSLFHIPWPGKGSADDIGWIRKVGPPTHDVTSQFEKLDAAAKAGRDVLPPDAQNYVYLAVPGVTSGAVPDGAYLDDNLDALEAAGCQTARVPVDTFKGVEPNARIIRDTIEKYAEQGKKVVLVCHSMGGLDAAAAISEYPEIRSDVRAMVTIQSPYGGSPVAQDALEYPALREISDEVFQHLLGGSGKALTDLTYDARKAFIEAHPMPAGIPTVCMASSRLSPLSPMYATQEYLHARYGIPSDGMVSPLDAFIPGSETVTLQGLDHLDTTGTSIHPFEPYHPGDLTLGLVALALKAPQLPASA